jgi:hypothetical protein
VIEACAEPEPSPESRYLRGSRVGICSNSSVLVQLRTRAEAYGAKVAVRITKTVQWLATTTPDALDPRHIAARTNSVPILEPDVRSSASTKTLETPNCERSKDSANSMSMRPAGSYVQRKPTPIGVRPGGPENSTVTPNTISTELFTRTKTGGVRGGRSPTDYESPVSAPATRRNGLLKRLKSLVRQRFWSLSVRSRYAFGTSANLPQSPG